MKKMDGWKRLGGGYGRFRQAGISKRGEWFSAPLIFVQPGL